jgi:hypothetical protein
VSLSRNRFPRQVEFTSSSNYLFPSREEGREGGSGVARARRAQTHGHAFLSARIRVVDDPGTCCRLCRRVVDSLLTAFDRRKGREEKFRVPRTQPAIMILQRSGICRDRTFIPCPSASVHNRSTYHIAPPNTEELLAFCLCLSRPWTLDL